MDSEKKPNWGKIKKKYRTSHLNRCGRCSRLLDDLPPSVKYNRKERRRCFRCMALDAERRLPGRVHDTDLHEKLLRECMSDDARCELSGRTGAELRRGGMWLEVDRVDSALGYAAGNVQLLASSLNRSKGKRAAPGVALDKMRQGPGW